MQLPAACCRARARFFEKTSCAVGQITGISSLSQEFKKARAGKSAAGFFASPILKQLLDSSSTTLVPPYF
jgi:hypothetical protein